MITNRGVEWVNFSDDILKHINEYTVPQYGDSPDDQASNFTEHDMIIQIQKYVNRLGSNQRGQVECIRDLKKICHYCCMLNTILTQEKEDVSS